MDILIYILEILHFRKQTIFCHTSTRASSPAITLPQVKCYHTIALRFARLSTQKARLFAVNYRLSRI